MSEENSANPPVVPTMQAFNEKDIRRERDKDYRVIYSTNARFGLTQNEVILKFAVLDERDNGEHVFNEQIAIIVSHDHAKRIFKALGEMIVGMDVVKKAFEESQKAAGQN